MVKYYYLFVFIFSDPRNCNTYQDCTNMNEAILVQCPEGTQYDATNRICDASTECIEIECSATSPNMQSYALNSPYYIICVMNQLNGEMSQLVLQCPAEFVFDLDNNECVSNAMTTAEMTSTTELTTTTSATTATPVTTTEITTTTEIPTTTEITTTTEVTTSTEITTTTSAPNLSMNFICYASGLLPGIQKRNLKPN
jgi:hypothetical protein